MKRLALIIALVVIITSPHIYSQLGKTVFPKIGFADPYTVSKVPFRYGGGDHPLTGDSLGGESDVDVEIFDINGMRVLNGNETGKQAGTYNYKWNASAHASGVYFVRITAKGKNGLYTLTSKLMLVK